jgi:hypothetical protein
MYEDVLSDLPFTFLSDGTVDIVDPLRIREQFGSILQSKLIATEVEVKLFLHKGLKFVHDGKTNTLDEQTIHKYGYEFY